MYVIRKCCSLFCFYIKPQRERTTFTLHMGCSLFCFYIKPQLLRMEKITELGCSLFCFYIKPQRELFYLCPRRVVPYSVSTSNHNCSNGLHREGPVVPYSVSTSNHNTNYSIFALAGLFLILFLHQTTTKRSIFCI